MSLEEFIKNLTKEDLDKINREFAKKENKKVSYNYSKITGLDLKKIFNIEENFSREIFKPWLESDIVLSKEVKFFLKELIDENQALMKSYSEEDLKVNFIIPILNKIKFKSYENRFRDFYELPLSYVTNEFTLKGTTDFAVSKGLKYSEKLYFFIQEFKKSIDNSNPEPQLLAELISAVELNDWKTIKGAYIIGENWSFVILNRLDKHKYEYFVSKTFNSTNFEDLKGIFKNLLFVKDEIIEMIKKGD